MFKLTIERTYKFKYVIYRNRRSVAEYTTKKQAKLKLYELHDEYKLLSNSQSLYNFFPMFLRGGDCLVIYTSRQQTLADNTSEEFKDYYEIKREINIDN